jgi:DNA polymerase III sliding clamp (beta) subunit (PCNA family)
LKITFSRTSTLPILKQALKTCNTKSKGKADSEFLVYSEDNVLKITSINEISEQTIVLPHEQMDNGDDFKFSINAALFLEFFNQFPEDKIQCVYKEDDNTLIAGNKKTKMAFPCGKGDDFSSFQTLLADDEFDIESNLFMALIKNTYFSVSSDWQNSPLTSLKFTVDFNHVRAESCDLGRISIASKESHLNCNKSHVFLIPKEAVDFLSSLNIQDGKIKIYPCKKHFKISWGNTIYISLLEGSHNFPDLNVWIEKPTVAKIKILSSELQNALKLSSLIAKDSYIKLQLDDKLHISAADDSVGMLKYSLDCEEIEGKCETLVSHRSFLKYFDLFQDLKLEFEFKEINENSYGILCKNKDVNHMIFPVKANQLPRG